MVVKELYFFEFIVEKMNLFELYKILDAIETLKQVSCSTDLSHVDQLC